MPPRSTPPRSALFVAIVLTGCIEASSRPAEVADWKRPRSTSLDISDASLSTPRARPDRFSDPFWSACYKDFQPGADPVTDLDRLGFACGAPQGYGAVSPIHTGNQRASDPAERLVFRARKGRCYRLFAVGEGAVRDLDVSILAPDGHLVAADLSKDAWSVVPPRAPWCPEEEGPFAVDISVADGQGAYALGVWGSEAGGSP